MFENFRVRNHLGDLCFDKEDNIAINSRDMGCEDLNST
jgi:hypothetical protein